MRITPALPMRETNKVHLLDWEQSRTPIYGEYETLCHIPATREGIDFYKAVREGYLDMRIRLSTKRKDVDCKKCLHALNVRMGINLDDPAEVERRRAAKARRRARARERVARQNDAERQRISQLVCEPCGQPKVRDPDVQPGGTDSGPSCHVPTHDAKSEVGHNGVVMLPYIAGGLVLLVVIGYPILKALTR